MKGEFKMFNFGFLLETTTTGSSGGGLGMILMIVVLIGLFVFMSRKQKKQDQKDAAMRDGLQVGDEVTTIGGIIGKVVSIKAETFVLETTKDKTKIRFLKRTINTVDVKAADIAASVIESNAENAPASEAEAAPAPAEDSENK